MDEQAKTPQLKIAEACRDIEKQVQVIQVQALNNLDELLKIDGNTHAGVDMKLIDNLVKGPLMRAVTKIRQAQAMIANLNNKPR